MSLFRIDFDKAEAIPIQTVSYATEGIKERQNLQKLIASNLACLGEDLFLVSESFKGFEGSLREIDILALDRDSNLVVIELKRTDGGEYADLQAIRYAAMLSSLNYEAVSKIHAKAFNKELSDAKQAIRDFLSTGGETPNITDRPRIYLIAPSFEKELATTCLWLINAHIDIRCIKAGLYKIGDAYHMDIEQELPQPSAQQYQYSLRDKQIQREQAVQQQQQRKRTVWAVPALEKAGILTPGTMLELLPYKHWLDDVTGNARRARFHDKSHDGIEWLHDGKRYGINSLTAKIFDELAKTPVKVNATNLWAIEGETESLFHRAAALSNEGDVTESDPIEEAIGTDGMVTP